MNDISKILYLNLRFIVIFHLALFIYHCAQAENIDDGFYLNNSFGILFVLDVSGSMSGTPLKNVKNTLFESVKKIKNSDYSGLISFSGCGPNYVKTHVPLGKNHSQLVVEEANNLETSGMTDISEALKRAEEEIKKIGKKSCVKVILLTDGYENCGGDQAESISSRIASHYNDCNKVDVISMNAQEWEAQVFTSIASAGKGNHNEVKKENPDELKQAIAVAMDEMVNQNHEPSGIIEWNGEEKKKNNEKSNDPKRKGGMGKGEKSSENRERKAEAEAHQENKVGSNL